MSCFECLLKKTQSSILLKCHIAVENFSEFIIKCILEKLLKTCYYYYFLTLQENASGFAEAVWGKGSNLQTNLLQ